MADLIPSGKVVLDDLMAAIGALKGHSAMEVSLAESEVHVPAGYQPGLVHVFLSLPENYISHIGYARRDGNGYAAGVMRQIEQQAGAHLALLRKSFELRFTSQLLGYNGEPVTKDLLARLGADVPIDVLNDPRENKRDAELLRGACELSASIRSQLAPWL